MRRQNVIQSLGREVEDASRDLVLHQFRQVLDCGCPSAAFVSNGFQRPTILIIPLGVNRIGANKVQMLWAGRAPRPYHEMNATIKLTA